MIFNLDGIIQIFPKDVDRIELILKQCNEQNYKDRLEAIKENYFKALKYLNCENHLYEELFVLNGWGYKLNARSKVSDN